MEAVRITRAGYPNRAAHDAFVKRYGALAPPPGGRDGAPRDAAAALASGLLKDARHAVGATRIYLGPGCLEDLERRLAGRRRSAAASIQSLARGSRARRRVDAARTAAVGVASLWRGRRARRSYRAVRTVAAFGQGAARRRAASRRCTAARRRNAATSLAAFRRGAVARRAFAETRSAAVAAQTRRRGVLARRVVAASRSEAVEKAKLENQLADLRRRLEEEKAERAKAEAEAEARRGEEAEARAPAVEAALVDESTRMLDYLRAEVAERCRKCSPKVFRPWKRSSNVAKKVSREDVPATLEDSGSPRRSRR